MAYWWVNHKQTFSSEIDGGYIWSPKKNSNGSRNQTYINLTLTTPGDVVFSYAAGKVKAIGVVTSRYREQARPSEFGQAGVVWANTGWAVPIEWEILDCPLIPKDHIQYIAPLLPIKNSPLQPNGNGNQSCYLAAISDELGNLLISFAKKKNIENIFYIENEMVEVEEIQAQSLILEQNIEPTEIDQLIKARKGQGKFRTNVERIEKQCRVTGLKRKDFLIASHIKPWRNSDNAERLDGFNGLLLSPHIDKLFDKGWISFQSNGVFIYAGLELKEVLQCWGINTHINVGRFYEHQEKYLKYHREYLFRG